MLPEAASCPAQGLLQSRVPAPMARPQRSGAGNVCKQPSLPTQALSAFLSVYSSNAATSPTKSTQRLQRAERVCCPQETDNAFPCALLLRRAALGPLGNGVWGAGCPVGKLSLGSAQPHIAAAGIPAKISSRSGHLAGLAEQVWKDHKVWSRVLLCNCALH